MNELVTITGLSKTYGHFTALNNMNLTIPRGRIIGLLGPNGSGKTTLIKLLNGLLTPSSGQILINGCKPGVETKAIISYLPERTYLSSSRRVEDLMEYFVDFYDNFNKDKALAMLESLHIDLHARMKTLSKGTKEKVQLVLVMSREADLYILDEPIAGVDPAARDFILKTIIGNYNENATVLLSTHLISDIEAVLDDCIFIRDGQVMLCSSVEDIRETYGKSVDSYFREVFAC
nr:ABC transporter ATP-binding protein [uncultured Eisenbergiella sp.]